MSEASYKQGKEELQAKFKVVEVNMEEGESHRQKLYKIVANCKKIKQLSVAI